jgi:hypothetical protein
MDQPTLRLLVHDKLAEGRLPPERLPFLRIGPSAGETCDGCGESVTRPQIAIEVLDARGGRVWFHNACFRMWDVERP